MNALLSLLFMQQLKGNSKKFKKNFKKKNSTSILILKNLSLMVYIVVEFICKTIYMAIAPKKSICQEVVDLTNVVNFNESKAVIRYRENRAINAKKIKDQFGI